LNGRGCRKCIHDKDRKNINQFLVTAKKIHGEKYDYSDVIYINGRSKINIKCKEHGIFEQIPISHLVGKGCPTCKSSKGEILISNLLNEYKESYVKNYRFPNCKDKSTLPFDFFLPKLNACIEYDGIQHFEPIKYWGGHITLQQRQKRDVIKDNFCNFNNIPLLRVKYNDPIPKETVLNFIQNYR